MEARVKLLGHPVHQMLIVLPLGLLSGAVVFDVVNLLIAGNSWGIVSFWLIVAGIVSGLTAALFGLFDYTKIPRGTRAKRIGLFHGVGNVVVIGFFGLSLFLRLEAVSEPLPIAYALSFLGGGLSLVTGWLGGELVDRLGVGVDDGAHLDAPSSLSGLPASPSRAA